MRAVMLSMVVLAGCATATTDDDESWTTIDQEVSVASFTESPGPRIPRVYSATQTVVVAP